MKKLLMSVLRFQAVFGQYLSSTPSNVEQKVYSLRHKLMAEENDEYLEACKNEDVVEIADALGDQLYILAGTINSHGMQSIIEEVFNEIHASNMSKLDENGEPIYREDGKILKGENYFRPDLSQFVDVKSKSKIEIIKETAEFYGNNPDKRAKLKKQDSNCVYLTKDGKSCAVGRCIKISILKSLLGNNTTVRDLKNQFEENLDSILKPAYKGHSLKFWEQLQEFHDDNGNFDYEAKSLTDKGKAHELKLIREYGD